MDRLKDVPSIKEIMAETEDTDVNGLLGKQGFYASRIVFQTGDVDQSQWGVKPCLKKGQMPVVYWKSSQHQKMQTGGKNTWQLLMVACQASRINTKTKTSSQAGICRGEKGSIDSKKLDHTLSNKTAEVSG